MKPAQDGCGSTGNAQAVERTKASKIPPLKMVWPLRRGRIIWSVIPAQIRNKIRTARRSAVIEGMCMKRPLGTSAMSRGELGRADPIAVKTVGHAMAELHQRDGAGLDISGVEHGEVAAVLPRAPDHRQQPAIAFRGILRPLDEDRFGNGVAGRQQIMAEALSMAVHMDDAGERAEHRQPWIGAGVPAVTALQSGAAVVDAREFAGEIVEIGLLEAVCISREIEGPAAMTRKRFLGIGGRAVGMRK